MYIYTFFLPPLFLPSPPPAAAPPPHAWEAPLSVSPPLRASRQLSRRESQVYVRGQRKLCGKTKFFQLCLTTNFAKTDAGTLASPRGGTNSDRCQWQKQGAVSGAALQFLQASAAARRKNRPSARGGGTALCAVTERGEKARPHHDAQKEKRPFPDAVHICIFFTKKNARPFPPAGSALRAPKEKCLLSQAFSVLWGKCGWRVKSFGQAARLTSRCGSRRGCSSASSSCRRTCPRCRIRPPSPAPAWPWRGRRSTRRCRRGGGPR